MTLRIARVEDTDAIRDVTMAAFAEYAAEMPGTWEGYRENILGTLATHASAEQLVAEAGGRIVGTVLFYPAQGGDPPHVRLLAVHPDARGSGIATALMAECVRRARASGADTLTLHTTDLMEVAKGMYERMGFTRAEELDFHPAPGRTVQGYRLALGAGEP